MVCYCCSLVIVLWNSRPTRRSASNQLLGLNLVVLSRAWSIASVLFIQFIQSSHLSFSIRARLGSTCLDCGARRGEELHELNDFKVQIDTLNANDLADEDSDISMLQIVERNLAKQKRIVAEFYNNVWGDSLKDLRPFQELAADLEAGLQGDVKQPTASTTLSDMTVYKQIPSEAAVTPTETRLS
ncbi:unnamed protein product [Durusdinium trenchii]|uniref:Uncharacterized protein n=1 Tax=Durusdinium trenchii TaxID=1381693 RepID=A0ABP0KXC0_9DINO